MGYYVNPPNSSKEDWLHNNGEFVGRTPNCTFDQALQEKKVMVCLIDNGWMSAAGICFSPDELAAFNQTYDRRPKEWYKVPLTLLVPYCSKLKDLL